MADVVRRTEPFVKQRLQADDLRKRADHVIVISHGGTMKALLLNVCAAWIPGATNRHKFKEFTSPNNCEMCHYRWPQHSLPCCVCQLLRSFCCTSQACRFSKTSCIAVLRTTFHCSACSRSSSIGTSCHSQHSCNASVAWLPLSARMCRHLLRTLMPHLQARKDEHM